MSQPWRPESKDLCECGHEAMRHFFRSQLGPSGEYGECSLELCDCKRFVKAADSTRRRCPCCGQWSKR